MKIYYEIKFSGLNRLIAANVAAKMAGGVHEFVFILILLRVAEGDLFFAGFIFFVRSLPFFILGPISGLVADYLPRVQVLVFCDVVRSFAGIGCVLALQYGFLGPPVVALYGAIMAFMHSLYVPAYSTEIKNVVEKKSLVRANGAILIASEVGLMVGPLLGAVTMSGSGEKSYVVPILCGCVLYLISARILGPLAKGEAHVSGGVTGRISLIAAQSAGIYRRFYIFRNVKPPSVRIAIVYSCGCIAVIAGVINIVVPQLIVLRLGSEQVVGVVMAALSAGTIAGSLACSKLEPVPSSGSLMIGWGVYGAILGLIGFAFGGIIVLLAWAFALGLAGAFIDIYIPTIVQEQSDPASIGNNFSLFSTSANIGEAFSGLIVGAVVAAAGIDSIIVIAGALVIILAFAGYARSAKWRLWFR